jgi:hypothetical protein
VDACTEFELLIERRLRDALDPVEEERLERHLVDCASCRDYARVAGATAGALADVARRATSGADWPALEKRLADLVDSYRRALGRMAVALVLIVPVIWFAAGPPAGLGAVGIALAMVGLGAWKRDRVARAAAAAGGAEGEPLRLLREELGARWRMSRVALAIELAMGTLLLAVVAIRVFGPGNGAAETRVLVFFAAWGVLLLIAGVLRWRVGLPRLRDERSRFEGGES